MPRKARRAGELRPQAVLSRPLHSCPSLPPNFKCNSCPNLLFPPEIPRSGQQQQEARSFWSYAFSRRFAWHLVWLSVIQLWHYLFIGTLNSLLSNLASGDRVLGM